MFSEFSFCRDVCCDKEDLRKMPRLKPFEDAIINLKLTLTMAADMRALETGFCLRNLLNLPNNCASNWPAKTFA
jgi:hypothetical protein